MLRVFILQLVAIVMAMAVCGLFAGEHGGISAALGGLVCALPNLLLGWRIQSASVRSTRNFIAVFFFGEAVKIAMIFGLLLVIAKKYDNLHWPSLLIGLVFATYALLFLVFWKKN